MATINGKWRWNETIEGTEDIQDLRINIRFDSGGGYFHGIEVYKGVDNAYRLVYLPYEGDAPIVFQSARNDSTMQLSLEEYRIIDFREELSIEQDAYEFIVANAEPFYDIADKLGRVYDNIIKVYNSGNRSGFEKGETQGYTEGYSNGKLDGELVGKAEGYENGYEEGRTEGYGAGVTDGKQAEYDAFWDKFQDNGKRQNYRACFGGDPWTADVLNPKYDVNAITATYMFYTNPMGGDLVEHFEKIGKKLIFDGAKGRNLNNTFDSSKFTRVGKIHATGASWYGTFKGCANLVTIDEAGNPAENGNAQFQSDTFSGCTALENITIVGDIVNSTSFSTSTKLTRASIESIVNHLSDDVSGKTLTLSKTAVDNAFRGISAGDFTVEVEGSSSLDWSTLTQSKYKWTFALI